MNRFNLPDLSPLLKSIKEKAKKVWSLRSKISTRTLLTVAILVTLLAGNSVFWIYRATRKGTTPSQPDLGLRQWELDLSEEYLDATEVNPHPRMDGDDIAEVDTDPGSRSEEAPVEAAQGAQEQVPVPLDMVMVPPPSGELQAETVEAVVKSDATPTLSTMALPTLGKIITEHSMDRLVYSKTLEQWGIHPGIDIAAEEGTTVKAAMEGTVLEVKKNDPKLGIVVVIDHGGSIKTLYGNLASEKVVKKGDGIKKGQVIGAVGKSAPYEIEDPPHLHFEILKDDANLDPQLYLPKLN